MTRPRLSRHFFVIWAATREVDRCAAVSCHTQTAPRSRERAGESNTCDTGSYKHWEIFSVPSCIHRLCNIIQVTTSKVTALAILLSRVIWTTRCSWGLRSLTESARPCWPTCLPSYRSTSKTGSGSSFEITRFFFLRKVSECFSRLPCSVRARYSGRRPSSRRHNCFLKLFRTWNLGI